MWKNSSVQHNENKIMNKSVKCKNSGKRKSKLLHSNRFTWYYTSDLLAHNKKSTTFGSISPTETIKSAKKNAYQRFQSFKLFIGYISEETWHRLETNQLLGKAVEKWKWKFSIVIYEAINVYNEDETGLFLKISILSHWLSKVSGGLAEKKQRIV